MPAGLLDVFLSSMPGIQAEETLDRVSAMLYASGRQLQEGDARRLWGAWQRDAGGGERTRRVPTRDAAAAVGIGFRVEAPAEAQDGRSDDPVGG